MSVFCLSVKLIFEASMKKNELFGLLNSFTYFCFYE